MLIRSLLFFLGLSLSLLTNVSAQIRSDGVNSFADSTLAMSDKPVLLSQIFVVGHKKTRKEIILRETALEAGKVYSLRQLHEQMVRDKRLVFNTRLFLTVNFNLHQVSDDAVMLIIEVKERQYILPIPVLTLADRNFNDWVVNRDMDLKRISYGVRLYHDNLTGRNDKLRVTVLQGFTRQYDLRYNLPYFDKDQKHGLGVTGVLARNNIIAVETRDHIPRFIDFRETAREIRGTGLSYTFRPNFYSFHDAGWSHTRVEIMDTVARINPDFFGEGQTLQRFNRLFYQYRRDVRDAINYPLKGSNMALSIEKFGLGGNDDLNFTQITGTYARYFDMGGGWYYSGFGAARIMTPADQPYNRLIALGFRQFYVRGYELDLIEGHQFYLQKNTLRKKLIGSSYTIPKPFDKTPFSTVPFAFYLKAFVDQGYVVNNLFYPNNDRLSNRYLFGYGLGLDFVTYYDLVFKLEYALTNTGAGGLFLNFRADF